MKLKDNFLGINNKFVIDIFFLLATSIYLIYIKINFFVPHAEGMVVVSDESFYIIQARQYLNFANIDLYQNSPKGYSIFLAVLHHLFLRNKNGKSLMLL